MRERDVAAIVGVILLVVVLFVFLGGGMMGFGGMWPGMMGGNYNQGYSPWWGIVMFLFWALVIGGVAFLITRLVRQDSQTRSGGADSPLEILKQRYARGEITREQYQQMRGDLE